MKLSFSTLAAPDWSFEELTSIAADLGYDGIELRGIADEMSAPRIPQFSEARIDASLKHLRARGLAIPILTAGVYLNANSDPDSARRELRDYILLAERLGTPYVRVMGEPTPDPRAVFDFDGVAKEYAALCAFAGEHKVRLLIETNGALVRSELAARMMETVDSPAAGILWDMHHTFRYGRETPEETVAALGRYICHTHIKDSVVGTNGRLTYMLNGYGDVPIEQAVKALQGIGYDGYLSYEWVKRWSRELAEPGVALYSYISAMRDILEP